MDPEALDTRLAEVLADTKLGLLGALMDALVMRRKLNVGIQQAFESLKRYGEH